MMFEFTPADVYLFLMFIWVCMLMFEAVSDDPPNLPPTGVVTP